MPRVRGRKPHDPAFDMRTPLYYLTQVDMTVLEGIDELLALKLVSELGMALQVADGQAVHLLAGVVPQPEKDGGLGKSSWTCPAKGRAASAFRLAAWSLMAVRVCWWLSAAATIEEIAQAAYLAPDAM